MARSNEPLVWAPFFAGAGVAAIFLPATIVVFAVCAGFGLLDADRTYRLLHHPLVRAYLCVVISLSLFHAFHRIRFILVDLGLKSIRGPISVICYGAAVLGTIAAIVLAIVQVHWA